jgi:hypothetical protein
MHCVTPEVLLVQLHAGEYLLEQEFYVHLFDLLRRQSEKVLHTLYNETKRLRKVLAVQWDEAEFGHFLASASWTQGQEQPLPRRSGRADPLKQLLRAAYQHPWAIGTATILDVVGRQASQGWQTPWAQRWGALLQAMQARHLPSEAVLVLFIDQLEESLLVNAVTAQDWVRHWRAFAEATRESTLPLLVVWAGTSDGLQPVYQALPDAVLTVYTLAALTDADYQRLAPRLRRAMPRPAQKYWQRLMTEHPMPYRYPGLLLLAAVWMAAMAETRALGERTLPSLVQADGSVLVHDLVRVIVQRHPDTEELFRRLLEVCAFLPPGKEFTVEDILPLCGLDTLGLDPLAGRTALETLLGDCVRYGFLTYDTYAARYTTGHGMVQRALQCLTTPDPTERQAVARWHRLAAAVVQRVRRGEGEMLVELARVIEAEKGGLGLFASYLVAPLRRILAQSSKDERQRMAHALGKFRSPMAVELLMTMLDDVEGQVRSRAVQSLADLEGLETCTALLKACKDSNSDVRWIAALALGRIEGVTTVEALIEMLADEDKEVGRIAAQGLGTKGDVRAVPHLITAMRDRYPLLRESAALALGQLADRRALPALQELLQDANRQVRQSAEKALARFSLSP